MKVCRGSRKNSYTTGTTMKIQCLSWCNLRFCTQTGPDGEGAAALGAAKTCLPPDGRALGGSVWWLLEVGAENWSWYGSYFIGSATHNISKQLNDWDREDSLNKFFLYKRSCDLDCKNTAWSRLDSVDLISRMNMSFGHWNDYCVFGGQ